MYSRRRSVFLALAFAIITVITLYGCGGAGFSEVSGSSGNSGNGPGGEGGPPLVPGQMLYGKIELLPFASLADADPLVLKNILDARAALEARGMRVSDKLLAWPMSTGTGWVVRLGDQTVISDENGVFGVEVPQDTSLGGTLSHPTDDSTLSPVPFALTSLSSDPESPKTLVVPMGFGGPCGMGEGDTEELCSAKSAAAVGPASQQVSARYAPPDWVNRGDPKEEDIGVQRGRLGTYPPPTEFIDGACPDTNGPGSAIISPIAGVGGIRIPIVQRSVGELIVYLGSICDLNVLDGSCVNEVAISNIEYEAFANSVGPLDAAITDLLGSQPQLELLVPLASVGARTATCKLNHKGRVCGNFLLGDISLDLGGEVITPDQQMATVQVKAGEDGTLIVHNNGAFGFTNIHIGTTNHVDLRKIVFSGDGLRDPDSPGTPYRRLAHFSRASGSNYVADRTLSYHIAENLEEGDQVLVTFSADNRTITVNFQVSKVELTPSFAALRAHESQRFQVRTSDNDPAGRTFEWSLANASGTLNTNRGKTVTYTAGDGGSEAVLDEITVKVFDTSSGGRSLFATASANIRISPNGITLSPPSASLSKTGSQLFTVTVTGQSPDAVLSYQWTTASGFGTLSNTDQASVTYTVKDDVEPPQTDAVTVKVFRRDNGLDKMIAELTAPISIVESGTRQVGAAVHLTEDFLNFEVIGATFDAASGSLSISNSSTLSYPSAQIGFENIVMRPGLGHGYFSFATVSNRVVESFKVGPAGGALTAGSQLGSDKAYAMAIGKDKLYLGQRSPLPTQRFSLDANGNATLDTFMIPGTASAPIHLSLLSDSLGEDLAIYQHGGNRLITGHRVGSSLANAEEVVGSPFTVPGDLSGVDGPRLYPGGKFLIVASSNTVGAYRLDCIEISPSTGDFIAARGSYVFPTVDGTVSGSPIVTARGFVLVYRSFLNVGTCKVLTVDTDGNFQELSEIPDFGPVDSDLSGDYVFAYSTDPAAIRTYRISASGTATLTDTDVWTGGGTVPVVFFHPQR